MSKLKPSEIRRIEAKKREWDKTLRELETTFRGYWKLTQRKIKIEVKRMLNWMFFYQPKDSGDKVFHLIEVFCVLAILISLLGR